MINARRILDYERIKKRIEDVGLVLDTDYQTNSFSIMSNDKELSYFSDLSTLSIFVDGYEAALRSIEQDKK